MPADMNAEGSGRTLAARPSIMSISSVTAGASPSTPIEADVGTCAHIQDIQADTNAPPSLLRTLGVLQSISTLPTMARARQRPRLTLADTLIVHLCRLKTAFFQYAKENGRTYHGYRAGSKLITPP